MFAKYQKDMKYIQDQIAALSARPPAETGAEWRALATRVNALCAQITRDEAEAAHAVLPALGALIQALDQVLATVDTPAA
jgi:hypothetical protein